MTKHRLKPIKSRRAKVAATYKPLFGLFGFILYPKKVKRLCRRRQPFKIVHTISYRPSPRTVDLFLQQDDDTIIGVSDGKGGVKPFEFELDWPRITATDLHKNLCAYIDNNTEL